MTTIGLAYLCMTIVAFLFFAGALAWSSARSNVDRFPPAR